MTGIRAARFKQFVDAFADRPPIPVSLAEVEDYELFLSLRMPRAWREFMLCHGSVITSRILGELVARNIDHPNLLAIGTPAQERATCESYWPAGMPRDVVSFGSDASGNVFGFSAADIAREKEDGVVVMFDHDFDEVEEVAPSFESFVGWYIANLR